MDFQFYLAVFRRRLPYFIVLLTLGTAIGLAVALTLKPVYVGEARLVVEAEQIPDDLAASTVRTTASEQLEIIQQLIFTRNNLMGIAERFGVYDNLEEELRPDEKIADLRQRIRMDVGEETTAIIVTVAFDAPTPELAADVTNEVVRLILQENIEMRTTVSGQTLEFFEQEAEQLEEQLSLIRGQIFRFQEANLEALPDSLAFRRTQQAAAQERILELERERLQLRDRRDRLILLFEQTGEVGLVGATARTAEEAELQDLQDQLNRASAVLSNDNPRIAVLRAQIAALERIVASRQAAAGSITIDEEGSPLTPFQLQLADLEGQIEFIDEQIALINLDLDELSASIEATPGNALTLDTLERNYNNLREQYDRAVSNRAAAEVGDTIEALAKGQRISVIEEAIPPSRPASPNRRLIVAMGIAAGLGVGAGLIALMELLNTAVRRPADIVNGLHITPLMTLPYIRTRGQIWRRRLIILLTFTAVVVGVPAALWYIDTNILPLEPIFEDMLLRIGLD